MAIKSVAHVCLKTRDLAGTASFYCDLLGLEKVFEFKKNGEVIGFYLQAANTTFLEVFRDENVEPADPRRTLHHFCFESDAIGPLRQRLLEHGFSAGDLILGADRALQFWVKDPNGIDIEIQQYTPESSQWSGETVELS
jgi:catechol 2,3-dioxygenase-like lactoylglutathione lyase family enzyme